MQDLCEQLLQLGVTTSEISRSTDRCGQLRTALLKELRVSTTCTPRRSSAAPDVTERIPVRCFLMSPYHFAIGGPEVIGKLASRSNATCLPTASCGGERLRQVEHDRTATRPRAFQ
jgi:hypothetical protein